VVSDRRIGIGHELEVRKQRTRVFCLLFDCSCGQLQFKRGGTVTARTVGGETSLLSATTTPPMYLVSPDRVFSLFPLFSPFLLSQNIKFSTSIRNGIVTEYFAFTTSFPRPQRNGAVASWLPLPSHRLEVFALVQRTCLVLFSTSSYRFCPCAAVPVLSCPRPRPAVFALAQRYLSCLVLAFVLPFCPCAAALVSSLALALPSLPLCSGTRLLPSPCPAVLVLVQQHLPLS